MEKRQIKALLEEAKKVFLQNESELLENNTNERSLTHKFAECLQQFFGTDWSVDCEYNRAGSDPKIIEEIKHIPSVGERVETDDIKSRTVYPDIIVHKRGEDGPNLLVIEAKKDATEVERDYDIQKLNLIKQQYNYSFSAFLNFLTQSNEIEIDVL